MLRRQVSSYGFGAEVYGASGFPLGAFGYERCNCCGRYVSASICGFSSTVWVGMAVFVNCACHVPVTPHWLCMNQRISMLVVPQTNSNGLTKQSDMPLKLLWNVNPGKFAAAPFGSVKIALHDSPSVAPLTNVSAPTMTSR